MARLTAVKTLAGFDFSFQPSLDRNRVLTLAQLEFIDRNEVVHVLGPPGTGKSQVSTATPGSGPRGRVAGDVCLNEVIADLARQSVRRLPGYSVGASQVEQGVKT
jgi:Fe-S cluster assembly ATPase SufC